MTIKAYRSTRYNTDRMPRQHKAQPKRTGSFWGISWQADDADDSDWDAMPGQRNGRR